MPGFHPLTYALLSAIDGGHKLFSSMAQNGVRTETCTWTKRSPGDYISQDETFVGVGWVERYVPGSEAIWRARRLEPYKLSTQSALEFSLLLHLDNLHSLFTNVARDGTEVIVLTEDAAQPSLYVSPDGNTAVVVWPKEYPAKRGPAGVPRRHTLPSLCFGSLRLPPMACWWPAAMPDCGPEIRVLDEIPAEAREGEGEGEGRASPEARLTRQARVLDRLYKRPQGKLTEEEVRSLSEREVWAEQRALFPGTDAGLGELQELAEDQKLLIRRALQRDLRVALFKHIGHVTHFDKLEPTLRLVGLRCIWPGGLQRLDGDWTCIDVDLCARILYQIWHGQLRFARVRDDDVRMTRGRADRLRRWGADLGI